MNGVTITHIGTATVLLEIGALRLLTDPALDPAGRRYAFGWGTRSQKTAEPALPPGGLGRLDAVLITHDQHADNLDGQGRALLPQASCVLTTRTGARRLGPQTTGLAPWERTKLTGRDGLRVQITATPGRHGPPLGALLVGPVIGFLLEWEGQRHGALYISGDTVWFGGTAEVARRCRIGTALLHVGGAGFDITGPLRYTFNGAEAARMAAACGARTVIPVHYEGWRHFRESRAATERAFVAAGLADRIRWLPYGVPTPLEC